MKIVWGILLLVCFPFLGKAQANLSLSELEMARYEHLTNQLGVDFHSDVRPYSMRDLKQLAGADTLKGHTLREGNLLLSTLSSDKNLRIAPITETTVGIDLTHKEGAKAIGQLGLGVRLDAQWGEKWNAQVGFLYRQGNYMSHVDSIRNLRHVIPGEGWAYERGTTFATLLPFGSISYQADDWLNIEAGNGRHFFGEGYRSLFLSDVAAPYPYLKLTTDVWRLKYVNLYSMQANTTESFGERENIRTRFTSTHYLTVNATKRLTFSLFETVVWHNKDQQVNRGFDINYLNPVIFYRPVEFSVGSSDNSLLGFGYKIKVTPTHIIYGQILLDEFLLDLVKEDFDQWSKPNDTIRNGWWANKYALQLGVKGHNLFGRKEWIAQTEINWVRPFVYTHGTLSQNYAHAGTPLAHPLGANFFEWLGKVRYSKNRWTFENHYSWMIYGTNPSYQTNYGGDLFVPYINRVREFENFTAQGIQTTMNFNHLKASYVVDDRINLRAEAGYMFRSEKNDFAKQQMHYFYVSITSGIFNRYRDY